MEEGEHVAQLLWPPHQDRVAELHEGNREVHGLLPLLVDSQVGDNDVITSVGLPGLNIIGDVLQDWREASSLAHLC